MMEFILDFKRKRSNAEIEFWRKVFTDLSLETNNITNIKTFMRKVLDICKDIEKIKYVKSSIEGNVNPYSIQILSELIERKNIELNDTINTYMKLKI